VFALHPYEFLTFNLKARRKPKSPRRGPPSVLLRLTLRPDGPGELPRDLYGEDPRYGILSMRLLGVTFAALLAEIGWLEPEMAP
jgi:hypothetical protein